MRLLLAALALVAVGLLRLAGPHQQGSTIVLQLTLDAAPRAIALELREAIVDAIADVAHVDPSDLRLQISSAARPRQLTVVNVSVPCHCSHASLSSAVSGADQLPCTEFKDNMLSCAASSAQRGVWFDEHYIAAMLDERPPSSRSPAFASFATLFCVILEEECFRPSWLRPVPFKARPTGLARDASGAEAAYRYDAETLLNLRGDFP